MLYSISMGVLSNSNRTGCIGEDYIQLLCSSAGISCSPNRQGQDVDAVDFTINYTSFPQQIQVKCTQNPKRVTYQKKECFSYSIDKKWNIRWRKSICPPLFALVVIPSNTDIFSFLNEGSLIRDTKAYWTRIKDYSKKTVHIPVNNLITEQVIRSWEQFAIDLLVGTGGEDK